MSVTPSCNKKSHRIWGFLAYDNKYKFNSEQEEETYLYEGGI